LHNIDASNTNVAQIFAQPSGGTSRRFLNQSMAPGEMRYVHVPIGMNEGDKLRGFATNADEVTFTVTRTERYRH